MAEELTEREVQAMIALWAQRQDMAAAGPTAADVAEALEISLADAEALAWEVRAGSVPALNHGEFRQEKPSMTGIFAGRLALASLALTGFFCAYLDKVLA